jgi:hypothetical protein
MQFTNVDGDIENLHRAYGPCSHSVLDQMSFLIGRATGDEPTTWSLRAYANGLVVPVPAVFDPHVLTEIVLRRTFSKAITRAAEALTHLTNGQDLPEAVAYACREAETFCRLSPAN